LAFPFPAAPYFCQSQSEPSRWHTKPLLPQAAETFFVDFQITRIKAAQYVISVTHILQVHVSHTISVLGHSAARAKSLTHVSILRVFAERITLFKEDMQYTYNVTIRRVRATTVVVEKKLVLHNLCVHL
jgi:hypothetical protein